MPLFSRNHSLEMIPLRSTKGVLSFKSTSGFTLVELIVVITILAILATVGFVVMSHQTSVARDGKRISEIQSLSSASRITTAQLRELPRPIADSLELTVSGSFIGYQGFMSTTLVNPLGYGSDKIFDPLDGAPYTYRVNKNYDQAQFMAYLENPRFERSIEIAKQSLPLLLSKAYALDSSTTDLSSRYPYSAGDKLGIFVSSGSNQPLQNGVTGTGSRDISLSDSSTLRIIVGSSGADGYVSTDISTGSLLSLKDGSFDEKALLGMNSGSGGSGSGTGGGGGNSCPMNPTAESYFTFDSNNGTITGYDEVNGPLDVVIPCIINGVSVVNIGWAAFMAKGLTSVVIPTSVTTIGGYAFYGNQLTSVIIPASVISIGHGTFYNNQLTSVSLSNSLISIGDSTFSNNHLTSINIPNSIVHIGSNAFYANELISVNIPNSMTTIEEGTFAQNALTSINIPNSVTDIQYGAFNNNQLSDNEAFIYARNNDGSENRTRTISYGGLKRINVIIPDNVINIGSYTFYNNQLTSVIIPNSVTTIGNAAFYGNSLTGVIIPNSVTNIEDSAFSTNQLTSIVIPSSLVSIGNSAFYYNQITSIVIPSSVASLGYEAFSQNRIPSSNEIIVYCDLPTFGNNAFANNGLDGTTNLLNPTTCTP